MFTFLNAIPPSFDWSKRLEYNWYSVEALEKLRRKVGPSLPYEPVALVAAQMHCVDARWTRCSLSECYFSGDGKSALIYLASIAREGTITLVVCPTNFRLLSHEYKSEYFEFVRHVRLMLKLSMDRAACIATKLTANYFSLKGTLSLTDAKGC